MAKKTVLLAKKPREPSLWHYENRPYGIQERDRKEHHMRIIDEYFETAMEAWSMMQKTSGDEGAEWAERFERYFYEFIDELKKWWATLHPKPTNLDEAEELPEIKKWMEQIPAPVQLNFLTELEDILDGFDTERFD
jgi:uncharacterized protein with von Willebrand factor type A (vWA) domain